VVAANVVEGMQAVPAAEGAVAAEANIRSGEVEVGVFERERKLSLWRGVKRSLASAVVGKVFRIQLRRVVSFEDIRMEGFLRHEKRVLLDIGGAVLARENRIRGHCVLAGVVEIGLCVKIKKKKNQIKLF
jgi:hypothetical protein